MKLLQKQQIDVLKAREMSREVQEGLKITRRVDSLREMRLTEESNLENWRKASLETIKAQIKPLEDKKGKLELEIRELQGKFDAMLPSIGTKRDELRKLQAELSNWQKELEKKAEEVLYQETDVAMAKLNAEKSLERQILNEQQSEHLLLLASRKSEEAKQASKTAHIIREKADADRIAGEASLQLRENAVIMRESVAFESEKENERVKKENGIERIRLADQRATLERELIRLRNARKS